MLPWLWEGVTQNGDLMLTPQPITYIAGHNGIGPFPAFFLIQQTQVVAGMLPMQHSKLAMDLPTMTDAWISSLL